MADTPNGLKDFFTPQGFPPESKKTWLLLISGLLIVFAAVSTSTMPRETTSFILGLSLTTFFVWALLAAFERR